ncbi:hypothetical protein [Candidatus Enterovibrio escicola]|uniref:hypothetical protein n=1 Tax=Candidatus Enterovibrio escicola TaxID=1927127 RepID=UPI001CC25FB2|nr:hypothetical protein [Candidatus Enterovibrio escacola]
MRKDAFVVRDDTYVDLASAIADKREIADFITTHQGVTERHEQLMDQLDAWWQVNLPIVETLAPDPENQHDIRGNNVYEMRSELLTSIEKELFKTKFVN